MKKKFLKATGPHEGVEEDLVLARGQGVVKWTSFSLRRVVLLRQTVVEGGQVGDRRRVLHGGRGTW